MCDDVEPGTVVFQRGYVESAMKSYLPLPTPSVVQLAAGREMVREGRVPLPLTAFHNVDANLPRMRAHPTHAVLEIGWIDDPEALIQPQVIGPTTTVDSTSRWIGQRWLGGERLPLP